MTDQKFRGVFRHEDGNWVATIGRKYLGYHYTFEAAKQARVAAEIEIHGRELCRREIEIAADHAKIPLHGRGHKFHGWAEVDLADLDVVRVTAWTRDPRGYVVGRPPGSREPVTLHKWLLFGFDGSHLLVDHEDRNRLNNRRGNLRVCTPAENARNTKLAKNNSSGFKGVSRSACGNWRARITVDWVERLIGIFPTAEQAAAAYDQAAIELHGNFASTNAQLKKKPAPRTQQPQLEI